MKKILIIEDDQKIAFALSVRLKANGYATWIAGDGITGLKMAVAHRPDLVLLDVSLPAGNGFCVAEQLHQMPKTRQIPIIIATASKDPELRQKAIELGVRGLVRKPYDSEQLIEVVQHTLDGADSSKADTPLRNSSAKRILIVEDDEKVAAGLAVRMKAAGFQTTIAADAVAGVRSAVQGQPDLVLLDISLPAGNGFSVAERIQRSIPTPTPIIFLTASHQPEFRAEATRLGAVGFFEKPYQPEELMEAVRQALA